MSKQQVWCHYHLYQSQLGQATDLKMIEDLKGRLDMILCLLKREVVQCSTPSNAQSARKTSTGEMIPLGK